MNRELKFRAWNTLTEQMIVTGFHVDDVFGMDGDEQTTETYDFEIIGNIFENPELIKKEVDEL